MIEIEIKNLYFRYKVKTIREMKSHTRITVSVEPQMKSLRTKGWKLHFCFHKLSIKTKHQNKNFISLSSWWSDHLNTTLEYLNHANWDFLLKYGENDRYHSYIFQTVIPILKLKSLVNDLQIGWRLSHGPKTRVFNCILSSASAAKAEIIPWLTFTFIYF